MTPDHAMELLMGWFPVIMIGVFIVGYIVSAIRETFRGDE